MGRHVVADGRTSFTMPEYFPTALNPDAASLEGAQHCAREFISTLGVGVRQKIPHLENRAPYIPSGSTQTETRPSGQRGTKRPEPELVQGAGNGNEEDLIGEPHPLQELLSFLRSSPRVLNLLTQQATGVYEALFDAVLAVDSATRSKQVQDPTIADVCLVRIFFESWRGVSWSNREFQTGISNPDVKRTTLVHAR